ncbi:MAG: hypothetical protein ITG02_04380 [Patulibacter sp.]|nr:hypothetical protein [Patulibacter sp.]
MTDALESLTRALRADGGLLAAAAVDPAPDADRTRSRAVAALPRSTIVGDALALAIEATREAELLHHAPELARVFRTDDRDLALLAGDRLYALGLARLAEGGWTDEVAILADVVAVVARLHADAAWAIGPAVDGGADTGTGPAVVAAARADDLWTCAVAALGHGIASPAAELLRTVRRGELPASDAMITAAGGPIART